MPFVWSVGTIIGPSIGGYFADPVRSFPSHFAKNGLFDKFPYLLPNLICSGLMLVSGLVAWIFLTETLEAEPTDDGHTPRERRESFAVMPAQPTSLMPAANITQESYGTFNAIEEEPEDEDWKDHQDSPVGSRPVSTVGTGQKAFTRRVVMITIALGIFTYHSMTYDHLLPIFFQDERVPPDNQHAFKHDFVQGSFAGGLGLSTQNVGVIMTFQGIIALVIQAVIFPLMASYLGVWRTFMAVTIAHPIAYFVVPWLVYLPENWLYPGIYACLTIRNLTSIVAYPILLILIKEASPAPNCLGKINGLAASTGAACRTLAAPIAGFLYGVGIDINFTALAWWVSTAVALIGTIQAFFINQRSKGVHYEVRPAAPFRFIEHGHEERARRRSASYRRSASGTILPGQLPVGQSLVDERTPLRTADA